MVFAICDKLITVVCAVDRREFGERYCPRTQHLRTKVLTQLDERYVNCALSKNGANF